jgi:hypothetical protein
MATLDFPTASPGATYTGGNGVTYTYDGTAGVWTAAASGGGGSFLPLAGGTMTGAIVNAAGTAAAPSLSFTGDLDTGFYSPGAGIVGVSNNGTGNVFIDASGRLLVGTSTTTIGNGLSAFAQFIGNTSSPVGQASVVIGNTGTVSTFNATTGIGVIRFMESSSGAEFGTIQCSADGSCGANDYPGRIIFSTTPSGSATPVERMRITNAGNVLIGTSSLLFGQLTTSITAQNTGADYVETLYNTNASPYGLFIRYSNSPNNNTNDFLTCGDAAFRMRVYSNGGIGNYQANDVNLSDINTKKDISPAAGTWDCLKEWEIVNYRYKDQPDDASLNIGVIAQQVAESCPEVVTVFQEAKEATETEPAQEERLGVKEQQMYWMAVKALQEAMARIEQLEARIEAAGI